MSHNIRIISVGHVHPAKLQMSLRKAKGEKFFFFFFFFHAANEEFSVSAHVRRYVR